jgi:hypothetical protein
VDGYYSGAMLALAVLLAERDSVYDDMVVKFLEQLVLVMDLWTPPLL